MAQEKTFDPWSVSETKIPAPLAQHSKNDFGFVPTENRQAASPADPLQLSVFIIQATRVGEYQPRKSGTAVLIAPDTLITAGHNVFDPTNSGFGGDRQGYAMSVQVASAHIVVPQPVTTRFAAPPGFTNDGDRGLDLAVVKLNAPIVGAHPLQSAVLSDQQTDQQQIVVYGYPNPAPPLYLGRGVCVAIRPTLLFHTADATEGESGGPVFVSHNNNLYLAGLHRAGPAETPGDAPPSCGAVRLSDGAIGWINQMEGKL